MRGAGRDITGRDIIYRYFGQLELLVLRFPLGEEGLKVAFEWMDAFTGKKVSQTSVAFEKVRRVDLASVLFNMGSVCSSIAALANRGDAQGLKTAYNYFQVSAYFFQFINDNFLHPPSVDLSRDSITVLVGLMLAQAQETFVEKVGGSGLIGSSV
ncbi:bck1-like resistance to osmotic shock [Kappamyces sp. JEL0680]|nr:bck1-like resistance to osmotic shock [Kappamyces sp. JEL0680]